MTVRRWGVILLVILAWSTMHLATVSAGEPSEEYRAGLKRTLELRKQRRAAQALVGAIATYPMPPALIIRQTRQNHDEIGALLNLLRYGGR